MVQRNEHDGKDVREERMRFETLLAELSPRFINLPSDQVDASIEDAQRRICEWLGLDLAVLWQWHASTPGAFVLTHHYRRVDGPPITAQLQATERFPWALREVLAKRSCVISSVDVIPEGAERDQESWRYFGLKNALIIPLSVGGGTPFGVVSFHDMVTPRTWSKSLLKQLELIAEVFANALERKRSEQALRDSEARLSMAADSAGVGLWSLDLASGRYWLTDKARAPFGFKSEESVTFDRFLKAVHPEDRGKVRQVTQTVVASKQEGYVEYRIVDPDGRLWWLASQGRVQCGPDGNPDRLMGVTLDITERKLMERALLEESEHLYQSDKSLREATESLRQAAEAAEFGAYRVDLVTSESVYSPEFLALFGLPPGATVELDSDHLPRTLHPDDRSLFLARMTAANDPRGSGIFDMEYRILRPDGAVRWLRVRGRTTFSGPGPDCRPLRANGIILDITERKQAELEVFRSRAEISHLSRVAMLGELSGSIAHELNQPLTAILSNAQAAQRFLADEHADLNELREILKDIVADDQRAGEIIRRLRILLKKGEVHHLPLDLNEVVQDVLKLIRNDLLNNSVALQTDFAPDLPAVAGDRVHLQQVLLNLIVNATDAMAQGLHTEKRLTVYTERASANDVRVSVSDSGLGLSPDVMDNLFTPFFTTKSSGMGLGLKVCRTIMDAHGGQIEGRNNEGRGATFTFTIPTMKKDRK